MYTAEAAVIFQPFSSTRGSRSVQTAETETGRYHHPTRCVDRQHVGPDHGPTANLPRCCHTKTGD